MSLWQMSFSGSVIILLIVVLRAVLIHKLPKKTFLVLWWVALIRLLVPFSVKSVTSIYSFLQKSSPLLNPVSVTERTAPLQTGRNVPAVSDGLPEAMVHMAAENASFSIWTVIWFAGLVLCLGFFAVSYIRCYREFRFSLPVKNGTVELWKERHPLKRRLSIRQTGAIAAPLSYGVIHPVILMPKHTDWNQGYGISYVLEHEYVHIRRFDTAAKLVMIAAVCIHWFNPLVWVMYILFNRDLELSCDETVVRRFGMDRKAAYAAALISMEEKKSGLAPLCSSFSKNAIEERIRAIMKIKKTSGYAVIISAVLVIGVAGGFATSAAAPDKETEAVQKEAAQEDETSVAVNDMTGQENEAFTLSDVQWWTAEEYEAWLENEKEALQSVIGEKAYTSSDGWFVWTQEMVDETIAEYEEDLQKIKDGMKLSKPLEDMGGVTISYAPEHITAAYDTENTEYDELEAETVTENSSNNTNVFTKEQLAEYAEAGITYQEETGVLMYDGKTVGYFRDEFAPHTYTIQSWQEGELWIATEREDYGVITGLEVKTLPEDFWSEQGTLAENSSGESAAADEINAASVEAGDGEAMAADETNDYGSEEGDGQNIAVPQEYTGYISSDAQGNWTYDGEVIADLYDERNGIYSYSSDGVYIEVKRDENGAISSFEKVSESRMQEIYKEFEEQS